MWLIYLLRRFFSLFKHKNNIDEFDEYIYYYDKRDFEKAYEVLHVMIKKYGNSRIIGDLYVKCAHLELLKSNADKALELLDKARKHDIHFMDEYYAQYGFALCLIGEYETGIEYLEKSAEITPDITNLSVLGEFLSINNDKRAREILEKALEKDPCSIKAKISLARVEFKSGNKDKALVMLKNLEQKNPESWDYPQIGAVYFEMEEYQSALDIYFQAEKIENLPKGPLYAAISSCYSFLGEANLAEKYVLLAEKLAPEDQKIREIVKELKAYKKSQKLQ